MRFIGRRLFQVMAVATGTGNFNNPSSPFMFLLIVAAFLLLKKVILTFTKTQARYFIPVIMIMDAPISPRFMNAFRFTDSSTINKLIMIVVMLVIVVLWYMVLKRYLFQITPFAKIINYLDNEPNLAKICEKSGQFLPNLLLPIGSTCLLGLGSIF